MVIVAFRNVATTFRISPVKDKYPIKVKNTFLICGPSNFYIQECQSRSEIFLPKKERFSEKAETKQSNNFFPTNCHHKNTASTIKTNPNKLLSNKNEKKQKCKLHTKLSCIKLLFSYQWNVNATRNRRSGDIELNPGPGPGPGAAPGAEQLVNKVELRVITYNARGLKDKLKLKRVLNKCYSIIKENRDSVVLFQESHLLQDDLQSIKMLWRHGVVLNPGIGRQGGTMILYDESWEVIQTGTVEDGRLCFLSAKKYNQHFCFYNVYAPNDHYIIFLTLSFES